MVISIVRGAFYYFHTDFISLKNMLLRYIFWYFHLAFYFTPPSPHIPVDAIDVQLLYNWKFISFLQVNWWCFIKTPIYRWFCNLFIFFSVAYWTKCRVYIEFQISFFVGRFCIIIHQWNATVNTEFTWFGYYCQCWFSIFVIYNNIIMIIYFLKCYHE